MRTKQRFWAATQRSCLRSISVAAVFLAAAAHAALTKETIGNHTCYVYAPAKLAAHAPLLMLFHGSGRDGMSQIDEWRKLADAEGIVLVAPNAANTRQWGMIEDGPDLMRDIAAFATKQYQIDPRRIYAFGHSAGAVFMLTLAPLESVFLAAVAVHAGEFRMAKESGLLNFAQRRIPIFIAIGTKDPLFSVDSVRKTRDAFEGEGFTVEVREIEGHDHNYYAWSRQINDMVWKFLSPKHLDSDPHFSEYKITPSGSSVSIMPVDP